MGLPPAGTGVARDPRRLDFCLAMHDPDAGKLGFEGTVYRGFHIRIGGQFYNVKVQSVLAALSKGFCDGSYKRVGKGIYQIA